MRASSSTSLSLKSSFVVIIILCSILNENCLNLLSFVDSYTNDFFSSRSFYFERIPFYNDNSVSCNVVATLFMSVF